MLAKSVKSKIRIVGRKIMATKYHDLYKISYTRKTHTHTHTQQLLEELQEKEQDIEALQSYASLLVQRIVEQAPDLLESIIQLQETQTIT